MRRLILVLLVLCAPAFARQRIFGFCEAGNATVTIGGLTSTTTYQGSYPSATVSVFATGTTNLATIYSDNIGTVKANPFTMTPGDGYWFAYTDNGRYDVKCSGTGIASPFTRADFIANDPSIPVTVVSFSATPTFAATPNAIFSMTLTASVTSSTITGSASGQIIYFSLCQDGTGGRTFAWPASFLRPPTVSAVASACTNSSFMYDGTNWRQLAATGDALIAPSGGALNGTFSGNPTLSGSASLTGGGSLAGSFSGSPTWTGSHTFTQPLVSAGITDSGTVALTNFNASGAWQLGGVNYLKIGTTNYLDIYSRIRSIRPAPGAAQYPLGNDMAIECDGPADCHVVSAAVQVTSSTSLTGGGGAQTITVATPILKSSAFGSSSVSGNATASLCDTAVDANCTFILDPDTTVEETLTYSILSGTTVRVTPVNNHTQPFTVKQVGKIDLDARVIGVNAADVSDRPVAFKDRNLNVVMQLTNDTSGTWPKSANQFGAVLTGANGANKELLFRNNVAASTIKVINSLGSANLLALSESGNNGPILAFGNTVNTPFKIDASTGDLPRISGGGTTGGAIFYGSQGGAGTSGIFRFRNNSTDDVTKAQIDTSNGQVQAALFSTNTNCSSAASPAVCTSAAAGSAAIVAATTSLVVNTSAVTASSQIVVTRDNSLGTKLSVTCNTQSSLVLGTPYVSARSAGVSFTVAIDAGPTTNPMCFSYAVIN